MKRGIVQFVAVAAISSVIAAAAPHLASDDRGLYEDLGRQIPLPDCWNLACVRVLVAGVLEHMPGPSELRWKTYAVVMNAATSVAVGRFAVLAGLSEKSGLLASWIAAFGFGSLYTLFDPYTSDALMYLMGPVLSILLLQGQRVRAASLAAVAVFAKEFAAAPLWMFAMASALARRWEEAMRTLLAATTVTLVWFATLTFLMAFYNYSFGENKSIDLAHGGYIALWLSNVGAAGALKYLFVTFSALFVLFPAGLPRSPDVLQRMAIASLPAAMVFVYVQQPERALWNFHFVVIPVAVAALEGFPDWAAWLFVACFGITNVRFGAQLLTATIGRVALVMSLLLAGAAVARGYLSRSSGEWREA